LVGNMGGGRTSVGYRLKAHFDTKSITSETCRKQPRFTIIYPDLQSLISSRSQGPPLSLMRREPVARVHERSESRLPEMDLDGKNHSRVYRARDNNTAPSAARSRPRVISANVSREIDRRVSGGCQYEYRYRTGSKAC